MCSALHLVCPVPRLHVPLLSISFALLSIFLGSAHHPQNVLCSQGCDVCLLGVNQLERSLEDAKAEMALSHEAAERKQKACTTLLHSFSPLPLLSFPDTTALSVALPPLPTYMQSWRAQAIDSVQKAQTKRWLKQEYKVALAAAVEDRVDRLCDDGNVRTAACSPLSLAELGVGYEACLASVRLLCRSMVDDHAEALLRATLDGKGHAFCAGLNKGCNVSAPRSLLVDWCPVAANSNWL